MNRAALPLTLGALAALPSFFIPSPAAAQATVYRCGSSYSQSPCPDGQAVPAADPRDEQARREGQQAAARDARLAEQLARERRQREAEAPKNAAPAAIRGVPQAAAAPASAPASHKKGRPKPPKPPKAKKPKPAAAASGEALSPPCRPAAAAPPAR